LLARFVLNVEMRGGRLVKAAIPGLTNCSAIAPQLREEY